MITMTTVWLLLLMMVASSVSQSTTDVGICTDEEPMCKLERLLENQERDITRLFDNQQQLLQQFQQLQQDKLQHLRLQLQQQQENQSNHQELLQQVQELRQQIQQLQDNQTNRQELQQLRQDLQQLQQDHQSSYQELRQQLQQLQQDNQTNHQGLLLQLEKNDQRLLQQVQELRQQIQQLQQDNQTNQQELLQLVQQYQTVLYRLGLMEKPLGALTPRDCYEIYVSGNRSDGVYTVYILGLEPPVEVYCDMTTDGGGWTVFQRRKDGSVDFFRNWFDYVNGFGNLNGEFWLGNDNLHLMTSDRRQRLRVDLADWEGNTRCAEYDNFKVGSLIRHYKLASLGTYNGTAGDSLRRHLGMKFSTKDQDNDPCSGSCATHYYGAWWYPNSAYCNPNGYYYIGGISANNGVWWWYWGGYYTLKFTEMKIRPFYV